jgi:hypothetical protein
MARRSPTALPRRRHDGKGQCGRLPELIGSCKDETIDVEHHWGQSVIMRTGRNALTRG